MGAVPFLVILRSMARRLFGFVWQSALNISLLNIKLKTSLALIHLYTYVFLISFIFVAISDPT